MRMSGFLHIPMVICAKQADRHSPSFWKRKERFPLKDGESDWKRYIELLRGKDIPFMLEFMHDNNIKTLKETAGTLLKWLKEA